MARGLTPERGITHVVDWFVLPGGVHVGHITYHMTHHLTVKYRCNDVRIPQGTLMQVTWKCQQIGPIMLLECGPGL